MNRAKPIALALALVASAYEPAHAAPVVYSAYAVTSGQLGSWNFTQALVVIRLKGDTENTMTTMPGSSNVYINNVGRASVTITQNGQSVTAVLDPDQIYARWDPTNGVVSFGSAIGPFYPISISCLDAPAGCPSWNVGDAGAGYPAGQINAALLDVIGLSGDSAYYSDALNNEVTADLKGPVLLTGHAILCSNYNTGNGSCPAALPAAITTDKGDLYFTGQDNSERGVFKASAMPNDD